MNDKPIAGVVDRVRRTCSGDYLRYRCAEAFADVADHYPCAASTSFACIARQPPMEIRPSRLPTGTEPDSQVNGAGKRWLEMIICLLAVRPTPQ